MDNETFRIIKYEGVLWVGVHVAISWIAYTQWFFVYILSFARFFMKKLRPESASTTSIIQDAKALAKVPKHLAIIFEKEASLDDVANLILWTFLLGTPFVTIHQHQGYLASKFVDLKEICEKKKCDMYDQCSLLINYHKEFGSLTDLGRGCHVMMSSVEDGRRKIAKVAESLCEHVQAGQIAGQEIDSMAVGERLKAGHLPEPELAISFSSFTCLHGFQPWNTRLTEIINLPLSDKVSYNDYLSAIKQYADCKQRFGK